MSLGARAVGFAGEAARIAGIDFGRRKRRELTGAERAEQARRRDEAWAAFGALKLLLELGVDLHDKIEAAHGLPNTPDRFPGLSRQMVERWARQRRADGGDHAA